MTHSKRYDNRRCSSPAVTILKRIAKHLQRLHPLSGLNGRELGQAYHVITGFDGTPVGEFGLAAFGLVQYRDLLNTFVLSFVPWSMVGFPRQTGKMLVAIGQGLRMGWRCHPIVAYPFEDNWHQPLWVVRRELGIDRIVD